MNDVRPKGCVVIPCPHPDCWGDGITRVHHFVPCDHPGLPNPILCWDHDPETAGKPRPKPSDEEIERAKVASGYYERFPQFRKN